MLESVKRLKKLQMSQTLIWRGFRRLDLKIKLGESWIECGI